MTSWAEVTRAQRSTLARTLTVHGLARGVGSCSSSLAKLSPSLPLAGRVTWVLRFYARLCLRHRGENFITGEWAWNSIGSRLQGPCYLSRDNDDRKIRARKQRTDIGKHSFVNRTIRLWNELPAEALTTFSCKSHIFRKNPRRLIISEEKWGVFEGWWRNVQKWREVKNGEWSVVKSSEVKWWIIIDLQLCSCMYVLCSTLCHYYLLIFVIF